MHDMITFERTLNRKELHQVLLSVYDRIWRPERNKMMGALRKLFENKNMITVLIYRDVQKQAQVRPISHSLS